MATFVRGDVSLHYDIEGDGFPVLLIAPGGMRSANDLWQRMPWNPRVALADGYRVIGMDQRNAGQSTAPVSPDDGWDTYCADQLALLDHVGVDRCHVVGMCIGGPFLFALLRAAPERFAAAVILQPVGIDANKAALEEMFDSWASEIAPDHPEVDAAGWGSFRANMWGGEFVLTASPDDLRAIATPTLLLKGNDLYHPAATSDAVADLLPDVTYVETWKDDDVLDRTAQTIRAFLDDHTALDNRTA